MRDAAVTALPLICAIESSAREAFSGDDPSMRAVFVARRDPKDYVKFVEDGARIFMHPEELAQQAFEWAEAAWPPSVRRKYVKEETT